ncbi:hypothetical protein DFH09DRAFT_1087488 [Mycena vulgaris]|nr:hypothetical protein DFH09DRAFT_1087488 [Mycena vulgaris]
MDHVQVPNSRRAGPGRMILKVEFMRRAGRNRGGLRGTGPSPNAGGIMCRENREIAEHGENCIPDSRHAEWGPRDGPERKPGGQVLARHPSHAGRSSVESMGSRGYYNAERAEIAKVGVVRVSESARDGTRKLLPEPRAFEFVAGRKHISGSAVSARSSATLSAPAALLRLDEF